jgi:hypothetical protein
LLGDASTVFLTPLLGMGPKLVLSSDAKKCQQAFLAPLPGKANDNKCVTWICS